MKNSVDDRKNILGEYIDHYRLTFEKREDVERDYYDLIEYEYLDNSKFWKKIIFPLNIIEDIEYMKYCNMVGKPICDKLNYHPPMSRINLIPKYDYVHVIPEIRFCTWSTSDFTENYLTPTHDKIKLESFSAIFRESRDISFMKTELITTSKQVGNVIIKRTEHRHVIDLYKLFEVMNYEFRFLKFELTEEGFNKLYLDKEIDLSNKEYIRRNMDEITIE
jgi:hypothetical protein